MELYNRACKSGYAVKSGVVKSGKINMAKAHKRLGPRHLSCHIQKLNQVLKRYCSTKKQRNLVDMATRTGNHEHTFHTPGQRVYCSSRIDKILTNMATLTNLSIKEWITDHKTLIASTSNKSTKGNITIQDYIIKTKLFKEWAVQSINRTIYAKSINKERLKTQNGEIREDIDQVAQMNEGDYFNILTEAASLIRQKHKKEIIKSGLKERELISKQQKTISIARRRLRGEVEAERITMLKNWINEATDKIKNHYQRKLELKDTRVKSFYRNRNGKINNTTFRELKEPRRTNRISEILTEDGARIRDNEGIHRIFEENIGQQPQAKLVREATLEDYLGDNAMDVIEADRQINEPFNHDEIQYVLSLHSARSSRDPPRGLGFLKLGPISHCIACEFGVSDDARDTILDMHRQLEQQQSCLVVEGVPQS